MITTFNFRSIFVIFVQFFLKLFLCNLAPNIHEMKRRGARDLRVVAVSAPREAWRSEAR